MIACSRRDGTSTWQRHPAGRSHFFVLHDLRHYAVETTLDIAHGFFGLLADGWDISDTEGKGPRGALPVEAVVEEQLVGLLDRERIGGGAAFSALEIRAQLDALFPGAPHPISEAITEERILAIRTQTEALHTEWAATAEAMEIAFDRGHVRQDMA